MPGDPLPQLPTALALRPREAAKALGISERTLWTWTRDPALGVPVVRVNGTVLYPVAQLQEWLSDRTKCAKSEAHIEPDRSDA